VSGGRATLPGRGVPLRRTRGAASAIVCSDGFARASHEVQFATGHCVPAGPRTIGFPRCDPSPFPSTKSRFPSGRPPLLAARVHSLVRPCPLRSLFACLPAPLFNSAQSCLGVLSLFAALPKVSTRAGSPSRYVPPTGFHNLSTGFSTFGFAGLFHPAATSRVSVQGFDPAPQPLPTRRRPVPPRPCRVRAHRLPGCHAYTIGLRGFVPRGDAFAGVGD